MTQRERIMRHLSVFGSITAAEAMQEYGIMRLASRIHEMRRDSVEIKKEMRNGKNRFGEPVSFAVYRWGVMKK